MFAWFRTGYLDLLGYIYNEHRGYTSIDRILAAVRSRTPERHGLHRCDHRRARSG